VTILNEGQRKRIAIEMENAVGFPPIFEAENGSIEVLIPVSFAGRGRFTFPHSFEFELVRIDANGRVLSRRTALYQTTVVP